LWTIHTLNTKSKKCQYPNILLIEDDSIEIMKFNRVLKLHEWIKVIEANNGEEALEVLKVKEVIPDIIVLDLNMPELMELSF
jgi:response regulator RpfG family c-di-GMP phosphodiesterase